MEGCGGVEEAEKAKMRMRAEVEAVKARGGRERTGGAKGGQERTGEDRRCHEGS